SAHGSEGAGAHPNREGPLRRPQAGGQTVCRTVGDFERSTGAHRSAQNHRRENMGTDPGRTVGVRGSTVSGFGSRVSGSTQDSPQQRSELWLILNMSHARSVTRNLWPGRNFFVFRKITVIVLTAEMIYSSTTPPESKTSAV